MDVWAHPEPTQLEKHTILTPFLFHVQGSFPREVSVCLSGYFGCLDLNNQATDFRSVFVWPRVQAGAQRPRLDVWGPWGHPNDFKISLFKSKKIVVRLLISINRKTIAHQFLRCGIDRTHYFMCRILLTFFCPTSPWWVRVAFVKVEKNHLIFF